MAEGLEVTIQYSGAKYDQVAAPSAPSSEFAILKKDLAHLRVHSPSQKNVRRVNGSFILHWPSAGTSSKVAGLADSLHTRWFKLCSDDPEALKLREFLSIESITLKQDGLLFCSTAGEGLAHQDASSGTLTERLTAPLPEIAQQPASAPVPTPSLVVKPPPIIPPPRVIPSAPRSDRQQLPRIKRKLSSGEGPSNWTRQRLDAPEVSTATTTPSRPTSTQPQPTQSTTSPAADPQPASPTPGDATKASPQPTQNDATPPTHVQIPTAPKLPEAPTTPPPPQPREPGEMTPRSAPAPSSGPPDTRPSSGTGTRPPPAPSSAAPAPSSPYAGSSMGNGNSGPWAPRRCDRDVNRLTRELWDTRRQLTAMQAREQSILNDLERLGVRPESSGADRGSRDALLRLEAEVRAERGRRVHAERALSDVERECAAPFVVPALFQAFMSISELSS